VDEEDLSEIEFTFCGCLVPNPIGKLVATAQIALKGATTKDPQATLGFTPSFENLSYFGWMDRGHLINMVCYNMLVIGIVERWNNSFPVLWKEYRVANINFSSFSNITGRFPK
jgi:hypothetical protein